MTKPLDATVTDIETRLDNTDHEALRLWLRLLACTNLVEAKVRQQLSRQFDTTLPRFDFLAQLERAPQGLTMSQLSEQMMVTGGNVTGIAKALEGEGLIKRRPDQKDRRIFRVVITSLGRKTFHQMAEAHEGWIVELFAGLSTEKQSELNDLLGGLKTGIQGLEIQTRG
ncbi:MAG: MarR family transcriptional regulator [Pseudomonadota bacterium]